MADFFYILSGKKSWRLKFIRCLAFKMKGLIKLFFYIYGQNDWDFIRGDSIYCYLHFINM